MRSYYINEIAYKGGYRLTMTEDGEEAGGGFFPYEFDDEGFDIAYEDALDTAIEFVGDKGLDRSI